MTQCSRQSLSTCCKPWKACVLFSSIPKCCWTMMPVHYSRIAQVNILLKHCKGKLLADRPKRPIFLFLYTFFKVWLKLHTLLGYSTGFITGAEYRVYISFLGSLIQFKLERYSCGDLINHTIVICMMKMYSNNKVYMLFRTTILIIKNIFWSNLY